MSERWIIAGIIANIVASMGAVGAVSVAVTTLYRQVNDARRAQASRIIVRTDTLRVKGILGAEHNYTVTLNIKNLSDLPIFDVRAITERGIFITRQSTLESIGDIDPPGDERRLHFYRDNPDLYITVVFEDAALRVWKRSWNSRLRPIGTLGFLLTIQT